MFPTAHSGCFGYGYFIIVHKGIGNAFTVEKAAMSAISVSVIGYACKVLPRNSVYRPLMVTSMSIPVSSIRRRTLASSRPAAGR